MKIKVMLALLAVIGTALVVNAQDGPPPRDGQGGPGQGGQGGRRPPPSPVILALDANHDGTIDADEIANASAALKTLDKNSDGKLTQDELRPPRPEGAGGPNGQAGGNRPPRRGPGDNQQPPAQQN